MATNDDNPPADELLTAREVRDRLGVSQTTLTRWVANGQLVVHRQLPGLRGARLFLASQLPASETEGQA